LQKKKSCTLKLTAEASMWSAAATADRAADMTLNATQEAQGPEAARQEPQQY
jgi:hypothetical protein